MMAQAAIHQGLALDAFPLGQDPFAASEVDVGGREVAEALVSSGVRRQIIWHSLRCSGAEALVHLG